MPTLGDTLRRILALPREAGTPAAAEARAVVVEHLAALGYRVVTQNFTFSPSALSALPLFGAGLGWLALVLTPLLLVPSIGGWMSLTLWLAGLAALVVFATSTGLGWITVSGDHAPRRDANLIATRGDRPIRRWIVAHLDSKAQGHSMAGRLVAVWMILVAVVAMTAVAALRVYRVPPLGVVVPVAALTFVAGTLAGRGRLRGTSLGARDNGTGVAAALAAAETITDPSVGILITGAEEFGLVGARIFAQLAGPRLSGLEIINIDTVDDEGTLAIVSHDVPGMHLAQRVAPALAAAGSPLRLRRLPLGILVDSLPLARAGAEAVTVGRLTWRTLQLIHTSRDTPENLSLDMAIRVGKLIGRLGLAGKGGEEERGEGASP